MKRTLLALPLLGGCLLAEEDRSDFYDRDGDGSPWPDDCQDDDAAVSPDVAEICDNGVDDDCNGGADGCALSGEQYLDAAADAVRTGVADEQRAGSLLVGAGDLDGDGRHELLIGDSADGLALFRGPASGDLGLDRADLSASEPIGLGLSAAPAGDLDGDGIGDLFAGAPAADDPATDAGGVWLLSGADFERLATWTGPEEGARAGLAVARAADTAAVGGFGAERTRVWLLPATPVARDLASATAELSVATIDGLGPALAAIDADGDGVDEIAVGVAAANRVWIVPADAEGALPLEEAAIAELSGESATDQAGAALSAGDVDGDGAADLLVGAPQVLEPANTGAAYLVTGPFAGARPLAQARTVLLGAAIGEGAGSSVAIVGDVDGVPGLDVLIGSPHAVSPVGAGTGAAWLVYQPEEGALLLPEADLALYGAAEGHRAGAALGAGDFDGDGFSDLAVASPFADPGDSPVVNGGAVYVVLGGGL